MKTIDFNLYLITDRKLVKGDVFDIIKSSLESGLKALQIREKDLSQDELFRFAEKARVLTSRYGAKLFINMRCDVALAVDADGIHLGAGHAPKDIRGIIGKDKLIGASAHSIEEAIKKEKEGADFITLGPIYSTPSKAGFGKPIGLHILKEARRAVKIPIFAIGGIKKENVREVLMNGGAGVAVISAILSSMDCGMETKEFLKELNMKRSQT